MKKLFFLAMFVFLLAACGPKVSDPAEPLTSGVKGQALLGPMCPGPQQGDSCPDQPYQAKLTVLTLDGREVTRIETEADGTFAINLPPGDYILHPETLDGSPMPFAPDVPFTVLSGQFTNIIVTYDSGIR